MESLNLTWEEKVKSVPIDLLIPQLVKTQAIHVERERALEELGISVDKNVSWDHAL
jgi:kinesin family protein 1